MSEKWCLPQNIWPQFVSVPNWVLPRHTGQSIPPGLVRTLSEARTLSRVESTFSSLSGCMFCTLSLWKINNKSMKCTVYTRLFVCLEFFFGGGWFSHPRIFSSLCQHYQWRVTNFDLYLALRAIEQWGFFNIPHWHLQWHRQTLCNGHFQGSVTLTPIANHFAVELSLPVLMT